VNRLASRRGGILVRIAGRPMQAFSFISRSQADQTFQKRRRYLLVVTMYVKPSVFVSESRVHTRIASCIIHSAFMSPAEHQAEPANAPRRAARSIQTFLVSCALIPTPSPPSRPPSPWLIRFLPEPRDPRISVGLVRHSPCNEHRASFRETRS